MEFEHLAWIGHWEIQEITFTSVFIIVKCKQLVLFFLRYTQIIRNTILKLGKTVCLDMQRVVVWVTRAFLVFSYPSFINSFWNAPSNSSGTINHALIKVSYITFFFHILMFDLNITWSSWSVPTWFYALSFCLVIGRLDICMNGQMCGGS